jgi:uncharacterized protein YqfA (UPF0365 family)
VQNVVNARISSNRDEIDLDIITAARNDQDGLEVLQAVNTTDTTKEIDSPIQAAGKTEVAAVA